MEKNKKIKTWSLALVPGHITSMWLNWDLATGLIPQPKPFSYFEVCSFTQQMLTGYLLCTYTIFFFFKFIYLLWESKQGGPVGGGEGERIPSRIHIVSTEPYMGLNAQTVRLWPELKPRVRHLTEPPRSPPIPFHVLQVCQQTISTLMVFTFEGRKWK